MILANLFFKIFKKVLEYKISDKDDFIGEWISEDYTGNITIDGKKIDKDYEREEPMNINAAKTANTTQWF